MGTFRVSTTKITLEHLVRDRVDRASSEWTSDHTQSASNAPLVIY